MTSTPNTSFDSDDCRARSRYTQRRLSKTSKPNEHATNIFTRESSPNADISAPLSPSPPTLSHRPPSPPPDANETSDQDAIERAYQAVWQHFQGLPLSCGPYPTFHFSTDCAYASLLHRFEVGGNQLLAHFKNEVRADWDPAGCTLTLRLMPTHVHEGIKNKFQRALCEEIKRIAHEYPLLRALCEKLETYGHADVKANGSNKSPDGQLLFDGAKHPTFIFEVAYSQREKKLLETIEMYFDMFEICTVLTIDVEYVPSTSRKSLGSPLSPVSLWTSMEEAGDIIIQQVLDRKAFRQEKQPLPGELIIPFKLLLPWTERNSQHLPDANLRFPFSELSDWVSQTEARQRLQDATPSPPPPRPKKRRYVNQGGEEVDGLGSSKRVALGSDSGSEPRRSDRLRVRA